MPCSPVSIGPDERLQLAYAAVTYDELAVLTRDLPDPAPLPRRGAALWGPWRKWLAGNAVLVTVWASGGGQRAVA